MKCIIVTFSDSYNFGASLQAFALKKTVKKYVEKVNVLNIKKQVHRDVLYFSGIKGLLYNPVIWVNRNRLNRGNIQFEEFTDQYLDLTEECYADYRKLKECPPDADIYISGSDQVFNPKRADPMFYLNFVVSPNSKVVSYAASLGTNKIPEENKAVIGGYLEKFDRLSLRERQSVDLFRESFGVESECHIDPVFLLDKEEWSALERKPNIGEEKYVLVYLIYRPKGINKIIEKLKKSTGLPVYVIERSAHRMIRADKVFVEYGPREFVWLIHHAEMVYTTSFHGTAFSLIFNKKLIVVNNIHSPERIKNLLTVLKCDSCLGADIDATWSADGGIDCDKRIEIERDRSNRYLQEVCNGLI